MSDFLFDGNACSVIVSTIFAVKIVRDHDSDLWNDSMSNIVIESPYMTLRVMAIIVMFAISITISKLFAVKMYMTWTISFRMGKGQMQICHSNAHI